MAVLCLVVSTKEIVMDENEFELSGVSYVAVAGYDCKICKMMNAEACKSSPECFSEFRADRRNVIFVEKQQ